MMMCPHCGVIVKPRDGLTPYHEEPLGQLCDGSRQNPRCAESDGRPLWNGKSNAHFARSVQEETQ